MFAAEFDLEISVGSEYLLLAGFIVCGEVVAAWYVLSRKRGKK